MADLAEALSTYQGLVGVTVGVVLTYWLGDWWLVPDSSVTG